MQFLRFVVLPGSAEAQLIWCGIVKCLLTIPAKNINIRSYVWKLWQAKGGTFFETRCSCVYECSTFFLHRSLLPCTTECQRSKCGHFFWFLSVRDERQCTDDQDRRAARVGLLSYTCLTCQVSLFLISTRIRVLYNETPSSVTIRNFLPISFVVFTARAMLALQALY